MFFAPLFTVPDGAKERIYELVLKRNVYGNENRGTWLGIHPNTMELTLCYTHIVDTLTAQIFENIVTQFVEFSKEMKQLLSNEIVKDDDTPSSSVGNDSSSSGAQVGGGMPDFSHLA